MSYYNVLCATQKYATQNNLLLGEVDGVLQKK